MAQWHSYRRAHTPGAAFFSARVRDATGVPVCAATGVPEEGCADTPGAAAFLSAGGGGGTSRGGGQKGGSGLQDIPGDVNASRQLPPPAGGGADGGRNGPAESPAPPPYSLPVPGFVPGFVPGVEPGVIPAAAAHVPPMLFRHTAIFPMHRFNSNIRDCDLDPSGELRLGEYTHRRYVYS